MRVLLISFGILALTAVGQAIVVWLTGSVALLADTVHNVGDALTAVPLALAFQLARRAPTRRFGYGLGRTEDLAGLAIVVLIGISGVVAFVASVERLIHPSTPRYLVAGMLAGVLGFVGNEVVAIYRIRQGRRMHSAALIADGQHARIDGYTSLSVAIGLLLVQLGIQLADPIIGLLISLVIARITYTTARDVGIRLLDGIEPAHLDAISATVATNVPGESLAAVRGRWVGHVIHVEVELRADEVDARDLIGLADRLEAALRAAGTRARRVTVSLR